MKQKATATAAKWVPKGAEGSDGEAPNGKSDALCIDKLLLLKFFEVILHEGQDPNEKVVDLGLMDRLPEEGMRTPRRSGRDAKWERLFTSGSSSDDQMVQTPGGTQISLATAMQDTYGHGGDEHPAQAAATIETHAAMMAWVKAMYGGMAYAAAGAGGHTTVMLRNIPNRYTRDMLTERMDASYKGQYDFVYLPIDFNSKCNMGYAFINFGTAASAAAFMHEFHGKRTKIVLPGFSSAKVCEVSYARVQGRDANMENLRDEKFVEKLSERPEWQPLFYDDDGKEIPFSKTLGTTSPSGKKKGGRALVGPPGQLWPVPMMYPPGAPYMAAMQVASMVAHTQARVQAKAAAKHEAAISKPTLFTPVEQAPLSPEKKGSLSKQIEFYFSTQNLCKDVYLRSQMDGETGYVPLQLISEFPKVRKLGAAVADVLEVLAASETLELDATQALIRLKDEAERNRWKAPVTALLRQVSEETSGQWQVV